MKAEQKKKAVSLGKALVFWAGSQSYACELAKIKEIVRSAAVTSLPNSTEKVSGVINVRGEVVPVIDFWEGKSGRLQNGSKETVVIVQAGKESIGLKVDRVSAIEDIHAYDLGDSLASETSRTPEIVSCHVYLSDSGLAPLIDVDLVLQSIKAGAGEMGSAEGRDSVDSAAQESV